MVEPTTQDTNAQPVETPVEKGTTGRLVDIEERLDAIEGRLKGIEGPLQGFEGRLKGFEEQYGAPLTENRVVAIVKDALKHPFTFPTTVKKKVAKVTVAKPKA